MKDDGGSGKATIEYVLDIGKKIYADVKQANKKRPLDIDDKKFYETLHRRMIDKYIDFAEVYPIVLRHIVYEKKFYDIVMKKFLMHVSNHIPKTQQESLENQAEYMVFMLRHEHPRTDTKSIYEYRNIISKQLKEDDDMLKKMIEDANKQQKEEEELGKKERRTNLIRHFVQQRACVESL